MTINTKKTIWIKTAIKLKSYSWEVLIRYSDLILNIVLRNCFNASNVSQTYIYDLEILKKYEYNWANLKVIVLPVSYFSLFMKLEASKEYWRVKDYVIYNRLNASQ